MAALLLKTKNKKQEKAILDLAELLGLKSKLMSKDELEDFEFGQMIKDAKTGKTVPKSKVMKLLRSHEN
jgi:hypothetical protein